jgi:hypothetical protein
MAMLNNQMVLIIDFHILRMGCSTADQMKLLDATSSGEIPGFSQRACWSTSPGLTLAKTPSLLILLS